MRDFTGESNWIVGGEGTAVPNSRLYPWRWGKSEFAELGWGQNGEGRAWKPGGSGCGLCLGCEALCVQTWGLLWLSWIRWDHQHWDELVLAASALSTSARREIEISDFQLLEKQNPSEIRVVQGLV